MQGLWPEVHRRNKEDDEETEHKYAVCKGDEKNGIAVHSNKFNHSIDLESAGVLRTAQG